MGPGLVVAQQRRRLIQVDNKYIDVAIVVEIPEGTAAATVRRSNPRPRGVDQLFEALAVETAEDGPRRIHRILLELLRHLGKNPAGRNEELGPAIVVKVGHS